MSYSCLMLSGAALLINGLGLPGRVPARDSGVLDLVIGALRLGIALLIASRGDAAAAVGTRPVRTVAAPRTPVPA